MDRNIIQNKTNTIPSKYNGPVNHKNLKWSILVSLLFLIMAFLSLCFFHHKPSCHCNKGEVFAFLYSLANFISENFNPVLVSIVSLGASIIVIFIKGENKHFYLQLNTFRLATKGFLAKETYKLFYNDKIKKFYQQTLCTICPNGEAKKVHKQIYKMVSKITNSGLWMLVTLFTLSLITEVYTDDQELYVSSMFASFSIITLLSSAVYYIIRYNNECQYFKEEQCLVFLSLAENNAEFLKYLSLTLPNSPEKYNNIEGDIELLKLLLTRMNFKTYDEDEKSYDEVFPYFKKVLIPFVAGMMKTYSNSKYQLILAFQNKLSIDFNKNIYFNKVFRYYLMVISRQFLIQSNTVEDGSVEKDIDYIDEWLYDAEYEFFQVYEEYDYNKLCDYDKSKAYFDIYIEYIEELHNNNLIQEYIYIKNELKYISGHRQLKLGSNLSTLGIYYYDYCIPEVVFLRRMQYN